MHRKSVLLTLALVFLAATAVAQSALTAAVTKLGPPERQVAGNTITSTRDPGVRITFPPEFKYVGAVRWPLYNVADAELHIFVDAGPDKRVRRYFWIQFEQYLPSKPNAKHDYSESEARTQLAGREWYVDADVAHYPREKSNPDSDGSHARALLAEKGYTFPPATGQLRLVYLTDETARKELMIIYEEDLASLGMDAKDVEGNSAPGHARFRSELVQRAKAALRFDF